MYISFGILLLYSQEVAYQDNLKQIITHSIDDILIGARTGVRKEKILCSWLDFRIHDL